LGTPNGLREPVWCALSGCGGGDEGFLWVRGVEAGRAGIEDTGAEALNIDVGAGAIGLERFVEGSWLGEARGKGWETDRDCIGNGFEFVDGNGFGFAIFGTKVLLCAAKGLAFATAGNVCAAAGNGLVEFIVGNWFVPGKPFCIKKGFAPVGVDCSGLL
jgi:hypothetical protein